MTEHSFRGLVVAVVLLHVGLLAAYTFPEGLVPQQLRIIAQVYARPVFHQRWELFAPDPPTCSCSLEVQHKDGAWQDVEQQLDHYLQRRMARSICFHMQQTGNEGELRMRAVLHRLVGLPDDGAPPFRLVQHCVIDPQHPAEREERVRLLFVP